MNNPKGLIHLEKDVNNKYYIKGIILYRHEMLRGHNSIILLYGKNDILKRNLVLDLIVYLDTHEKILAPEHTKILNAYIYGDSTDEPIYIDLNFKDAIHDLDTEELKYVIYTYKYPNSII